MASNASDQAGTSTALPLEWSLITLRHIVQFWRDTYFRKIRVLVSCVPRVRITPQSKASKEDVLFLWLAREITKHGVQHGTDKNRLVEMSQTLFQTWGLWHGGETMSINTPTALIGFFLDQMQTRFDSSSGTRRNAHVAKTITEAYLMVTGAVPVQNASESGLISLECALRAEVLFCKNTWTEFRLLLPSECRRRELTSFFRKGLERKDGINVVASDLESELHNRNRERVEVPRGPEEEGVVEKKDKKESSTQPINPGSGRKRKWEPCEANVAERSPPRRRTKPYASGVTAASVCESRRNGTKSTGLVCETIDVDAEESDSNGGENAAAERLRIELAQRQLEVDADMRRREYEADEKMKAREHVLESQRLKGELEERRRHQQQVDQFAGMLVQFGKALSQRGTSFQRPQPPTS